MFVGGAFTEVKPDEATPGTAQAYVAAFDLDTGEFIDTWRPTLDRAVYALTEHNGRLIVGGEFETVNGVSHKGIVALDPGTGVINGSFPFSADRPFSQTKPAIVRVLELDGDMLYAGGNFDYINKGTGGARQRSYSVGRVNLGDNTLDPDWKPRTTGSGVWDVAVSAPANRVAMVGYFTAVNAEPNTGLMVQVDRTTGVIPGVFQPYYQNESGNQQATVGVEFGDNYVYIDGAQHMVQVRDITTNALVTWHHIGNRYNTGCWPNTSCNYDGGGDYQVMERIDDYIIGGCHCFGTWEHEGGRDDSAGWHYSAPDDIRTPHRHTIAYNQDDAKLAADFVPDLGRPQYGVYAIGSDSNGCYYIGGDYGAGGSDHDAPHWLGSFGKFCPLPATPAAPTVVSADAPVKLDFVQPATGLPVDRWRVYRDGIFVGSTGTDSYTDVTAIGGQTYLYQVQGKDSYGRDGALSPAVAVAVGGGTSQLTVLDDLETNLGWVANPDATDNASTGAWAIADAGEDVRSNIVVQRGDSTSGSQHLVTGPPINEDIDNGVVSVRSPQYVLPTVASMSILLDWYFSTNTADGNDFYRITLESPEGDLVLLDQPSATAQEATWTAFNADITAFSGRTVTLLLEAADAGNGHIVEAGLDTIRIVTTEEEVPDITAPTIPDNVVVTAVDDDVTVSWDASDDGIDGSGVKSYLVYRDYVYIGLTLAVDGLTFLDEDLPDGTYTYHVRARDFEDNTSDISERVPVEVGTPPGPDVTAPSVPDNVAAVAVDDDVTVSWDASDDGVGGSGVKAYLVYRNNSYIGRTLAVNGLTFLDEDLADGSYTYKVRSKDFEGNTSAASATVSVDIGTPPPPDVTAPSIPTNVASSVAGSDVTITWDPSDDGVDGSGVKNYFIYRDFTYIGRVKIGDPLVFVDAGLAPGTYRYHMRVKDYAGNTSGQSDPTFATVP